MSEHPIDEKNVTIPFTARLMAHYRAQERKRDQPLIIDPFAERLAGDLSKYFKNHIRYSQIDYPLVRSYYIEHNLLIPWCKTHMKSQIVLLGSGLDTRAYRIKALEEHNHVLFEIDFESINSYKSEILQEEQPYCKVIRISSNLQDLQWVEKLHEHDFSDTLPTFWILEGIIYYMNKSSAMSILSKSSELSIQNSQIFVDMCIPVYAEIQVGPFSKHFKWGLEKEEVPRFFRRVNWNISCEWADNYDQGRDVGQKGLIFIQGKPVLTPD
jgi:methyltransferase (TIGR00027 family)